MTLEEWNLAINNASNIWMAGMMTIQAIFVIVAAYYAHKTHEQYYEKKIRAHALSIKKDTQKLIYIQDIIFNLTEAIEFQEYQAELKKKMEGDHYLMYVKSALKHNLYLRYKKETQKLQMRVERELEFLGDKKLKSLNSERENLFQDIIRKFLVVEGKFTTLYSKRDLQPEILKAEENTGYKIYRLIPELIGKEDEEPILEINLTNGVKVEQKTRKPSGLKLLDKQFNDLLTKYY